MTTATIGQTIARATRGRRIRSTLVIVVVVAFAIFNYRYYYNFFLGPFPANPAELFAASDSGDLSRYYLTVAGDDVYDTGFSYEEKTDGIVTGRSNYLALAVGDRLLLVETPSDALVTTFTGHLEQPKSDVQRKVIDAIVARNPKLKGIFLPMQLSDDDFKGPGYVSLVLGTLLLGWCLWCLFTAIQWAGDNNRHPMIRALGRFGDARQAVSSIDAELIADHQWVGNLHLTPAWLVHLTASSLRATRFEDVVWVYKKVTTYRVYGIPAGKVHTAMICDRHGTVISIRLKDETLVNQMLAATAQQAPWALMGYNAKTAKAWRRSRASVLASVEQRLQQFRTTGQA